MTWFDTLHGNLIYFSVKSHTGIHLKLDSSAFVFLLKSKVTPGSTASSD